MHFAICHRDVNTALSREIYLSHPVRVLLKLLGVLLPYLWMQA